MSLIFLPVKSLRQHIRFSLFICYSLNLKSIYLNSLPSRCWVFQLFWSRTVDGAARMRKMKRFSLSLFLSSKSSLECSQINGLIILFHNRFFQMGLLGFLTWLRRSPKLSWMEASPFLLIRSWSKGQTPIRGERCWFPSSLYSK